MLILLVVAQDKTVVLYSAHNQEIIDAMIPRFEAATGIKAEVIKLGSGDVVARVKAEKENPQCDVIWSIGGEQLEANTDLLESYTPKEWDKIADVFKVGTNWLPHTGIVMVFIVNTDNRFRLTDVTQEYRSGMFLSFRRISNITVQIFLTVEENFRTITP